MGRRIIYKIRDDGSNQISEAEWEDVERVQHWYNSEFRWSTGKIALRRFVVFANFEDFLESDPPLREIIGQRTQVLRNEGFERHEIIRQLERDQLVTVKWGGYYDGCLASGFTRVANNEWNAYLVCDFLLKVSRVAPRATIEVEDEGQFVKTGRARFRGGDVWIEKDDIQRGVETEESSLRVFSVVDPDKYDHHRRLRNSVPEFNWLKSGERRSVVRDWNWLGYGNGDESQSDDERGADLNLKVARIHVSSS